MKGIQAAPLLIDRQWRRRFTRRLKPILLVLVTAITAPAFAAPGPLDGSPIGKPNHPQINLYIARTQLTRDPADERILALKAWLEYVANHAAVGFLLHPASAERWQVQLAHEPDSCALANARLPEREQSAYWLKPVLHDSLVIVGRIDDPFQGSAEELLRQADGMIGAASGIYRSTLQQRDIRYIPVDDQGAIVRMIDMGRLRFGLLVESAARTQAEPGTVRILGKLTDIDFWFSCSRRMAPELVERLRRALELEPSERLRQEFLALWARRPPP